MTKDLPLLLIILGILLMFVVHFGLGLACILIGLVIAYWPEISGWRKTRRR